MSVKKGLFSARLSRPFDMDVAGHNRPFESMFRGEKGGVIESGFGSDGAAHMAASGGDVIGGTRVGDVGGGCVDSSLTGTPKSMNSSTRTNKPTLGVASKGFGELGLSSKRMVSDFLRSRRKTERPAP